MNELHQERAGETIISYAQLRVEAENLIEPLRVTREICVEKWDG